MLCHLILVAVRFYSGIGLYFIQIENCMICNVNIATMKHKHNTSLRTLIRVSVKCCNLFKSPECSSTYFFACLQRKRINCWANTCQGSPVFFFFFFLHAYRTHTYLRTSNFSSMVHGFDRMPSIMSRCIWMFSNTSPVIGSSVDNFLWVSLQLQANKKDISIKRISGTEGACYLSSYCMSYFTIIFVLSILLQRTK